MQRARKAAIFLVLIIFSLSGVAQSLSGKVTKEGEAVPFVTVHVKEAQQTTSTDVDGYYRFEALDNGTYTIVVSGVGYEKSTSKVTVTGDTQHDITLKGTVSQLDEVVVTGTMQEVHVKESPVKVEVITADFLATNPTSNIMEAIATVNGVQECVTCGVCGTNDIHINGMEGSYSMIMIDGMPIMGSLASVYGLNGIPTEMIEQVEVIKGPSSTLYGTEAVSGVINVITKKPEKMPLITVNAYGTTHQEKNLDFAITPKMGKVSTLIGGNYYHMDNFLDANGDDFSDVPLTHRISLFNKWSVQRKNNKILSLSAKYYYEDRFGGVSVWTPQLRGSSEVYGESIYTDRKELIGSYQLPTRENIRLDFSHAMHDQNSYYGDIYYKATQDVSFANLYWSKDIGVKNNIIAGFSSRYQVYDDNTVATKEADRRYIPGIFVQNEHKFTTNFKTLAGIRWDHHYDHGNIFSPRFSLKYNPWTYTTVRLNSGTGFKVVNLFTEDHAAYTGTRVIEIREQLNPETSYNATLNVNHVANALGGNTTLDVDLFYNYFTNKIIPDYESDRDKIIYENLDGHSQTRGVSFNVQQTFSNPLTVNLGGTWLQAFEVEDGEKLPILYAPAFSGVFTVTYALKKWNTTIDYTGNVFGSMHLPTYDAPFERPETSPWYSVQNLQVTKKWNDKFSLYIAAKNLLNYTQTYSPLVDYENPFSDNFDTSYSYGPLQERRYLMGIRLNIR